MLLEGLRRGEACRLIILLPSVDAGDELGDVRKVTTTEQLVVGGEFSVQVYLGTCSGDGGHGAESVQVMVESWFGVGSGAEEGG